MKKAKVGIVILAAGESKRMGQPKQLLQINQQSLIRRTIDVALATNQKPVILVIGAHKVHIAPEIVDLPITIIDNPMWHEGMAASVKMGMAGLWMTQKDVDAVLMLVCDQPHLSVDVLAQMIETYQTHRPRLVACGYGQEVGVPVLFDRSLFEELLTIKGEKGAKSVLMQHLDETHVVWFEGGAIDLDTPQDYAQYLGGS